MQAVVMLDGDEMAGDGRTGDASRDFKAAKSCKRPGKFRGRKMRLQRRRECGGYWRCDWIGVGSSGMIAFLASSFFVCVFFGCLLYAVPM